MADAKLLLDAGTAAFRAAPERSQGARGLERSVMPNRADLPYCRANYGRRPAPEPRENKALWNTEDNHEARRREGEEP